MIRMVALLLLAAMPMPGKAQVLNPVVGSAQVDTSNLATKADAQAAATAAAQAKTAADAAAASAATKCTAQPMIPPTEVVGGAAGSGTNCRVVNSIQPRITRVVPFTTTAAGTADVTWAALGSAPGVVVVPTVASGASSAPICLPVAGTITTTGATIRCWTTQSVTVSILGAAVAPITTAAAGVTGSVIAIPYS